MKQPRAPIQLLLLRICQHFPFRLCCEWSMLVWWISCYLHCGGDAFLHRSSSFWKNYNHIQRRNHHRHHYNERPLLELLSKSVASLELVDENFKNYTNSITTSRGGGDDTDEIPNTASPQYFKSKSGVHFSAVADGINRLYPSSLYNTRNAQSLKDGYWRFVEKGLEPDQALVYGEFDLSFFAQILDRAHDLFYNRVDDNDHDETNHHHPDDWTDRVFVDLGSGTGRLVVAAAALHPKWKLCRGIEVLEGLHHMANNVLDKCRVGPIPRPQQSVDLYDSTTPITFQSDNNDETWLEGLQQFLFIESENNPGLYAIQGLDDDCEDGWDGQDDVEFTVLDPSKEGLRKFSDPTDNQTLVRNMAMTTANDGSENPNIKNSHDDAWTTETNEINQMLLISSRIDPKSGVEERTDHDDGNHENLFWLPLAPVEVVHGSFMDPNVNLEDADCIFCFSTAMPYETLTGIAKVIGRQCQRGTLIITTDYALPLEGTTTITTEIDFLDEYSDASENPTIDETTYQLELVEQVHGDCWITGGQSTAFIHRVVKSSAPPKDGVVRKTKELSLEEKTFRLVKAVESVKHTEYKRFALNVRNDMAFHGFPESWFPKLDCP